MECRHIRYRVPSEDVQELGLPQTEDCVVCDWHEQGEFRFTTWSPVQIHGRGRKNIGRRLGRWIWTVCNINIHLPAGLTRVHHAAH